MFLCCNSCLRIFKENAPSDPASTDARMYRVVQLVRTAYANFLVALFFQGKVSTRSTGFLRATDFKQTILIDNRMDSLESEEIRSTQPIRLSDDRRFNVNKGMTHADFDETSLKCPLHLPVEFSRNLLKQIL